jgi:hypothetical protein
MGWPGPGPQALTFYMLAQRYLYEFSKSDGIKTKIRPPLKLLLYLEIEVHDQE